MSLLRCLVCGSSQLAPEAYKCGRCGNGVGLRQEACYISDATKLKLLGHASELSRFGIEIEQPKRLQKDVLATMTTSGFVVTIVEVLRSSTVRELVLLIRDWGIPEPDILALRLGEPEPILKYCRMDTKQDDTVITWKGPKKSSPLGAVVSPPTPLKRGRPRKNGRRAAPRKPRRPQGI
jgi:hypothetical protein